MKRILAFAYGIICYLAFLAAILYLVGFVGDIVVPKSVNTGASSSVWSAVLIDVGLISLFGIQHSVMARDGFKDWWTKFVPEPIERSTFVLFSSVVVAALLWFWQPIPGVLWSVEATWATWLLWGLFGFGWFLVFASANMINGFHLFGVQQVWQYMRGQEITEPEFKTPGFYKYIRHPLMTGFFIAFWAIPTMTVSHALFAGGMSVYILVGLWFEERDLIRHLGEQYREYRKNVPALIPWIGGS